MSNIFKIEITGDEMHTKLGGGIPKSSLILIEALSGIGKSILAQRMTYGALLNEHSVSYISTELTVPGFLNQMESLNYKMKDYMGTGKFKFVTFFPSFAKLDLKENIMKRILSSKELIKSDILVFDTLSEILLKNNVSSENYIDIVGSLKKVLTYENGKSIILCVDPSIMDEKLLSMLRRMSEVFITMEERELYGAKLYYMIIKRLMGAQNDVTKEIPFKVRAGIGIVIEIAT